MNYKLKLLYLHYLINEFLHNIHILPLNYNKPKLSLLKYNNKWDYNHIIFKFYNNNLLNSLKYKYIIYNYINYMFNHKFIINHFTHYINILYKTPIIIYNNNNIDIILFIFKPQFNNITLYNNIHYNNNSLISRIIFNLLYIPLNKLINNFNININIKPIILLYDYMDSDIYSKSLSKYLYKTPSFNKINNITINNTLINKLIFNKINNITIMNNINYINNYINHKLLFNKNIFIFNFLLFQYIIGFNYNFNGKNYNLDSNARSIKYNFINGKFNNLNHLPLKLNYIPSNITSHHNFIINKNGKFNISVKLSHF